MAVQQPASPIRKLALVELLRRVAVRHAGAGKVTEQQRHSTDLDLRVLLHRSEHRGVGVGVVISRFPWSGSCSATRVHLAAHGSLM